MGRAKQTINFVEKTRPSTMRGFDRILSTMLLPGGIGHGFGSSLAYRSNEMEMLWAFCASLFVFMLGAIQWLRTLRPADWGLAWICVAGFVARMNATIRLGQLAGNLLDVYAVFFMVPALGLCGFSLRTIRGACA